MSMVGGAQPQAPSPARSSGGELRVAGVVLVADCAGALYWPDEGLLAVADLHLEKGSSFAKRGVLLPPYDTATTLAALARLVVHYAPRTVVALGDSFHDGDGPARILDSDRATLVALQRGRDWIWIAGNHDPDPVKDLPGISARTLAVGALVFHHQPAAGPVQGEIAGHLHPLARVAARGRTVSRRCFAADSTRVVMPAFGALTGGLNVRNRAFAAVFETLRFTAHVLGEDRIYTFTAARCLAD